MQVFNLFSLSNKIYKSISTIGKIHSSTDPILSFLDWLSGYSDFAVLKHQPAPQDMAANIIYFYGKGKDLYYTTKATASSPVKLHQDKRDLIVCKKLAAKIFGKTDDDANITEEDYSNLSRTTKDDIYKLLLDNKNFKPGFKYFFHRNILLPYREFEQAFVTKHPLLVGVYRFSKRSVVNCIKFTTSETGCRILSLSTLVALAVVSGGAIIMAAAAAYGASVAFSITRQTIKRMGLNNLREEAELLERYATTYAKKLTLARERNIVFNDVPSEEKKLTKAITTHPVIRWIGASLQYLSIYSFEVAIPVATAFLSPIHAPLQLSLIVAAGGISATVGVILQKQENDKMALLREAIRQAQTHQYIPAYKNLAELRKDLAIQENQLTALEKTPTGLNDTDAKAAFQLQCSQVKIEAEKSIFKKFGQALYQTINPFDLGKDPKDSRDVLVAVEALDYATTNNHRITKIQQVVATTAVKQAKARLAAKDLLGGEQIGHMSISGSHSSHHHHHHGLKIHEHNVQ